MLSLKAEKRDTNTKAADLRKEGVLPAIVYGRTTESTPVSLDIRGFEKVWKEAGESTIVSIDAPGGKIDAIIHDVQLDPISNMPTHADFYAVEAGKVVTVEVPVEFVGVAPAVKELGGILVKVVHEIEIEALPKDLPHDIKVDISTLATLDSHISIKDVIFPEGVTPTAELDEIVAAISVAKEETETADVDVSAIEVEKKGKKEEESAV